MAKRPAEEPLEHSTYQDSPSTKKVRLEPVSEQSTRSNGSSFSSGASIFIQAEHDERNGRSAIKAPKSQASGLQEAVQGLDLSEEESIHTAPERQKLPVDGYNDLYLDTINRSVLDFDFEKLCSVTLSNINVYACLVCGKYFQGRGPNSHAYFHALDIGHHVYVNMRTKRVYVLPEGYEVTSKSLDDIKFVVDPRLSKQEVAQLDKEAKDSWDLAGKKYHPG